MLILSDRERPNQPSALTSTSKISQGLEFWNIFEIDQSSRDRSGSTYFQIFANNRTAPRLFVLAPRAGFEPAVRSTIPFECRTGDSRAYSRPAPASRGPGYTTLTRPSLTDGARARILISWAITLLEIVPA